ncbi:Nicotinamide N-methyltransferase-like protein [Kalmanozyma brasiliensis GHG001]|uniref:Uncharacterized protein n=1 Tax=Kalmanozyma brasiliensis (strain GHG001) TaxID=1365824 RepID=V5GJD0_KALBG|nr:Nicotinamide N-methyltransferase-like protein [Kalmanozyma brasiliensis GHG001]EST06042.1 Nicotinamide N-methyltransferase-like protein [Kalmanozyma brasiliensis GHG001]
MSGASAFLPSRDLRDLRTLDLSSSECLDSVRDNLESLARLLGASGGFITHAPPQLAQKIDEAIQANEPAFEHPPGEVDSFERSYVTRWLTRLISELSLICSDDDDDDEAAAQAERLSEQCAELIALAAGRMAAGASVQDHIFQLDDGTLTVKLRDGALIHDSLGTHTWGAAPLLSQLLLPLEASNGRDLRILELGAGTGLVGLALASWSRRYRSHHRTQVVCTDYHPTVLENLAHNISLNGWSSLASRPSVTTSDSSAPVSVVSRCLDWQSVHRELCTQETSQARDLTSQTLPSHLTTTNEADWASRLDVESHTGSFDILVAADCVYDPVHPLWIRSVAEKLLRRPDTADSNSPLLHVMVPLRPTHQQEVLAVYQAFGEKRESGLLKLVILSEQDYHGYENFGAWNSVVRSETATHSQPQGGLARTYRWFQIGWQTASRGPVEAREP